MTYVTHDHVSTHSPTGKVSGVLATRADLVGFIDSLEAAGVPAIEVLHGTDGLTFLDGTNSFLGDLEDQMKTTYHAALDAGHFVFAAASDPSHAVVVAETALAHGAKSVVSFGRLVNQKFPSASDPASGGG
ncbi:MAG: hypothetical protein ABI780_13645, partial [Ardenticatenales bacterium]